MVYHFDALPGKSSLIPPQVLHEMQVGEQKEVEQEIGYSDVEKQLIEEDRDKKTPDTKDAMDNIDPLPMSEAGGPVSETASMAASTAQRDSEGSECISMPPASSPMITPMVMEDDPATDGAFPFGFMVLHGRNYSRLTCSTLLCTDGRCVSGSCYDVVRVKSDMPHTFPALLQ